MAVINIGDKYISNDTKKEYEVSKINNISVILKGEDNIQYPIFPDFYNNLPGYTKK